MTRPILTREARERCASDNHGCIIAPLNAATYCRECGALFLPLPEETEPEAIALDLDACEAVGSTLDIDYREQIEKEGQMRLPE